MAEDNSTADTSTKAPEPGSDEYNQQMADSYRNQGAADTTTDVSESETEIAAKPEGGADKFYNAETGEYNWQAHAREAEYRLQQGKSSDNKSDGSNASETAGNDESAKAPDLSRAALQSEFREHGKLTDETRQALISSGVPEDTVSWMEATAQASAESEQAAALEAAGGEEAWQQMSQWAANNLDPSVVTELNERLDGPNWRNAMSDLQAHYRAANGTGPKGLIDGGSGASTPAGFQSRSQMIDAMNDRRYNVDAAYTKEVMQKVKFANFQD